MSRDTSTDLSKARSRMLTGAYLTSDRQQVTVLTSPGLGPSDARKAALELLGTDDVQLAAVKAVPGGVYATYQAVQG